MSVKLTAPTAQTKPPALMSPSKMNSLEPISLPGTEIGKRLQVNDMRCKLKVCRLTRAVFALEFESKVEGSLEKELVSRSDVSKKVNLSEFFGPQQTEMY